MYEICMNTLPETNVAPEIDGWFRCISYFSIVPFQVRTFSFRDSGRVSIALPSETSFF